MKILSILLAATLFASFSKAALVGQWTFENGSLADTTGNFADIVLEGNASLSNGALDINGSGTTATGWAHASALPASSAISNKTLVSWITLQGLDPVARHGGAIAIDMQSGDRFDAIVFGERDVNRWMNGSSNFQRTPAGQFDQAVALETVAPSPSIIQLAISYQDLGGGQVRITGYRDGIQMGQYQIGYFVTWAPGEYEIIFGPRHTTNNSVTHGALDALIHEGRLYNTALTQAEIQALELFVPGDTDSDGLNDQWELANTQPPNLTDLNGLEAGPGPGANTGDFDGDGSLDINELANNTNPTNKDTDGDGLNDNVETGTGIFVNAGDAGTNPRNIDSDGDGLSDGQEVTGSLHYPKAVIGLNPKFYYRLDETSTSAGVIDAMGSAAPGSYNGDYINGPAMVGGPGPVEAFGGIALPGVGGAANLAHYSNNAGHIVLGPGSNYGANNITVALFLKAGSAQGGDRIFTNNLADNTKSFQIVTANDGLVLAIDPSASGANAERTLFLEDNSGPDRRLIDPNAGWFHVVASTSGATGPERASNFRLWINGIDRTDNLKPNVTGWGINTNFAKIGGRRDNPTDSTTHSGAQDEVSIWLDRVLTETEVQSLWTAARAVTPATDPTKVDTDGDGFSDGIEVNVLKSDPLNPLLPGFSGSLLGHWTFESGSELKDLTGNFPDVILEGDAAIADGALNINGTGTTATGWARSGAGGKSAIGSKTLVSWITLQGLEDVARHGAPMALDSPARDIFDAIVFAERDSNRWMNGSSNFQRTPPGQFDDGAVSVETAPTPAGTKVMLAITYADLGGGQVQITGYRNGVQMGTYSSGFFAQWPAGDQEVLFGPRHTSPGTNGALDALVHEARLYGKAATAAEIMTLFTNGPVGGEPLEFTGIVYNAAAGTADVEWVSKPGKTYRLEWSSDLTTWIETDDSYPTGGAIGNRTTYRFEGIPPNEGKRFFQAIEE